VFQHFFAGKLITEDHQSFYHISSALSSETLISTNWY